MHKILIALLAIFAFAGMSFGATRKHHSTKHATTSAKAKTSKPAARSTKSKTRRTTTTRSPHRSYQTAPTPERYKEIQQALASKGYYKGEVNGQWGADSVQALRRFQGDQNLVQDGKLGSLSLIALGLGPNRMTAQARPQSPTAAPNQATQPPESKP